MRTWKNWLSAVLWKKLRIERKKGLLWRGDGKGLIERGVSDLRAG